MAQLLQGQDCSSSSSSSKGVSGSSDASVGPLQRGALVLWLRAAVDVLAALAVVDPGMILDGMSQQTGRWVPESWVIVG